MVSSARGRLAWIIALGVAVAGGLLLWGRGGVPQPPAAAPARSPQRGAPPAAAAGEIPRIDLARLEAKHEAEAAGQRDLFDYGAATAPRAEPEPAAPPPTLQASAPSAPPLAPPAPAIPPLNVRYVGSVSNERGLKVAILMTDRKEILAGQAGEVVANRFRIVKIGYESVDIQDLGSDHVRRIPFKGN